VNVTQAAKDGVLNGLWTGCYTEKLMGHLRACCECGWSEFIPTRNALGRASMAAKAIREHIKQKHLSAEQLTEVGK